MALSRLNTLSTYQSTTLTATYTFDVGVDVVGGVSVRNIRGPNGLIQDSYTSIPDSVMDDISTAKSLTKDLIAETTLETGTATFTAQTSVVVTLATPLLNTDYRVALAVDGPVGIVTSKTTTTFTIVLDATYTGTVDWAVLQKASNTSMLSGSVTFNNTATQQAIVFSAPLQSSSYRVLLSADGYYPVRVLSKKTTGFTIEMGISLVSPQTAVVGFDVFV